VIQGFRTWAEQDLLYAQGRTSPGNIVTNAKGGESWHCFGCAADCAPMNPDDTTMDWNPAHPSWQRMEAIGISLGLNSGSVWDHPDNPHFQLTGRFPWQKPDADAQQVYLDQGAETFWQELASAQ
jgi:peptidoglycan L-alanyl-D-glutamate endopeptidase CwlK